MAGTIYGSAILWPAPFEPGVLFMPGTIYGSEILCLAPFEHAFLFMPGTIVTVVIPSGIGSKCAFGAR